MTGYGGSALSRGIGSVVRVPADFGVASSAQHAAATNLATGANEIIRGTTNHLMERIASVANEAVRPGGDIQGNFGTTALNGIPSGAEGPTASHLPHHVAER